MAAIAETMAVAASRRFVDTYVAVASGVGARLSLYAALAPDLATPTPSTSAGGVLRSLAPLVRPGSGLQIGAAALQEAMRTVAEGAVASRHLFESLKATLPFAAAGGMGKVNSYASGLAAVLPSTSDGLLLAMPSLGSPPLAGSSRIGVLVGILAGVSVYSIEDCDGFLFCKESGDNDDEKPSVPSPGNGTGVGGGGGSNGGGDDDRYRLLLKLLLELCQSDDSEEARTNFQQLKQLMQREWFELHKKREALDAEKIFVGTDKEKNIAKSKKLDADLARLKELFSEVERREEELEERFAKMASDELKLKDDRAVLDEQLQQAELEKQKLAKKLYRVSLDAKIVKDMWNELQEENAKMAATGQDSTTGKKDDSGGKAAGEDQHDGGKKKAKESAGFWSKLWAVANYPLMAAGCYQWSYDTYFHLAFIGTLVAEIPNMDRSTLIDVLEKGKAKHEANLAGMQQILVDYGFKKEREQEAAA